MLRTPRARSWSDDLHMCFTNSGLHLTLYIPYSNLGLPYSILVRHRVNKYTIIVPPLLPMDAQFNQSVVAGRVWSILGPRRSAKHRRAVGNVLRERCRYPWICEHRQARYALCCAACCLSASLFSFIAQWSHCCRPLLTAHAGGHPITARSIVTQL